MGEVSGAVTADELYERGNAWLAAGRPELAECAFREAFGLHRSGRIGYRLGVSLLQQGRYEEGWPYFEHRSGVETVPLRAVSYPRWQGESVNGRAVLLWGEQGIGDEIQMARFVPILKRRGATRVTVACLAPNVRLFQLLGADLVMERRGKLSIPQHDFWVPMLSLPHCLGVTISNLEGTPYLPGARGPRQGWGVISRGNPRHEHDAERSIFDSVLAESIPGAVEISPIGDMIDALAQISQLRGLVTVDTSWAHLAGAAGIPCHVLLSTKVPEWRWQAGAASTPWYKSLRLHWQTVPGSWREPIASAASEVRTAQSV